MTAIQAVAATETGLEVSIDGSVTELSWRWVRDHGEDEASFDTHTHQRRVYAIGSEPPEPATGARLQDAGGTPGVAVTWPTKPATTWISQATLTSLLAPPADAAASAPLIWHGGDQPQPTKGRVDAVLTNDAALADWLADIRRHGFGLLGGFDGGHHEVAELAARIGAPMSTIFGTTWDLASDLDSHDDTAYTQDFLAPHTDGTYLHEAPGLQMFCCTERDGAGGESVVVDGFALAATMRNEHADDFDLLADVSVPAHYIEPGVELRASRPAIRLDQHGNVVQISMNNYDRSPMHLPKPGQMDAFYRAYGQLHDLANDRSRWMTIRLEAGDVLINDNWRVLHGRQAYTGSRRFVGCYLNRSDFESRWRTLQ